LECSRRCRRQVRNSDARNALARLWGETSAATERLTRTGNPAAFVSGKAADSWIPFRVYRGDVVRRRLGPWIEVGLRRTGSTTPSGGVQQQGPSGRHHRLTRRSGARLQDVDEDCLVLFCRQAQTLTVPAFPTWPIPAPPRLPRLIGHHRSSPASLVLNTPDGVGNGRRRANVSFHGLNLPDGVIE
jgi:hypothetical protein